MAAGFSGAAVASGVSGAAAGGVTAGAGGVSGVAGAAGGGVCSAGEVPDAAGWAAASPETVPRRLWEPASPVNSGMSATMISTRRFSCRPSGVALLATGW